MSSPSIRDQLDVPTDLSDRSVVQIVAGPLKRLAFYAAIVLPFLHVPLLLTGLQSQTVTIAFGTLLVLNVVALFVAHYYDE